MSAIPLAYFLTFSTYGVRLPGDGRGTVYRGHAGYGEAKRGDEPGLAEYSRMHMADEPMVLDRRKREIVEHSIREHCEFRGWCLHALNIRTTHVHVVVSAEDHDADFVMRNVKARSTKLLRDADIVGADQRVWGRHGSTRFAWSESAITEMIDYVLVRQGIPLT